MKKDWIKRLPPGEYTTQQLKEFGGLTSHTSIKKIMTKYGATVVSVPSKNSNFCTNIFSWPGFIHDKQDKNYKR